MKTNVLLLVMVCSYSLGMTPQEYEKRRLNYEKTRLNSETLLYKSEALKDFSQMPFEEMRGKFYPMYVLIAELRENFRHTTPTIRQEVEKRIQNCLHAKEQQQKNMLEASTERIIRF